MYNTLITDKLLIGIYNYCIVMYAYLLFNYYKMYWRIALNVNTTIDVYILIYIIFVMVQGFFNT
jgi:hypothetical protein